ncbi:MAG: hypothetical protein HS129_00975 [Leptospiraceae bacterium]|nr:hypothetical protein [Leptospiraceae bacterium]NUM40245.1 hypothetical protein [Leptospiraceae bacterium]
MGNQPLISTLFNNRMLLLLKGTYATDDPLSFEEYSNGTGKLYMDDQIDSGNGTDPPYDLADLPQAKDLAIFLDIGEIRISSKYQKGIGNLAAIKDARDSKKFWDFIAPERQVYCTIFYSATESTCHKTGLSKINDFFSGRGAQFPSNDPTAETNYGSYDQQVLSSQSGIMDATQYYYTGVYFRSLVTGWAREAGGLVIDTVFDNHTILTGGANIVPRNNYKPGTEAAIKDATIPAMFPLLYSVQPGQNDMSIRPGADPYILEIRANIKENLMVHSYVNTTGNVRTLISFSDWNNNHASEADMGGNLLSRARVIYPEKASSLEISGGTKSLNHYYAVFRSDEIDFRTQLPLAASPVKQGTTKIKYIHEGNYKLQCVGDISRIDGYPDTIVRETNFSVSPNSFRDTIRVNLTCP